ncbi:MAG: hypothetical protein SPJ70_05010 [Candidatus Borkfalkiaceae bacterium]|nr:hypothetical protein [Christensenellaceae bacterium]
MGAGNSGFFKGTSGAKRYETKNCKKISKNKKSYNLSDSKSVKRVDNVIISNNAHNVPEHSLPNSVHINKRDGILSSERYFDEKGKPYLDIDYTDHGNAKIHPIVPHEHSIKIKDGKFVRDKKWREIQK